MATPPDVLAVAYRNRYNRLRIAAGLAVAALWDRLDGIDDTAAEQFAAQAARISEGAQRATAASVDGYLSAVLAAITGAGASAIGLNPVEVTGAAVRAGVAPTEVYLRPIITARAALTTGRTFPEAIAAGRARASSTAAMDVALTQRAATVQALSAQPRVVGYRRVLSGASCSLCQVASTQRYHVGELMPIHNQCDCGVVPIVGERDPGQKVNSQFAAVAEDAPRPAVHEHGELGPVLTDREHEFAGPADIAA